MGFVDHTEVIEGIPAEFTVSSGLNGEESSDALNPDEPVLIIHGLYVGQRWVVEHQNSFDFDVRKESISSV
ncbi:MAG: hypothetical protein R2758_03330 [Bacteroidales bacterium]